MHAPDPQPVVYTSALLPPKPAYDLFTLPTLTRKTFGNFIVNYSELTIGNEMLGSGQYGQVYKGIYLKTAVAIKVLKSDIVEQKGEEFVKEAFLMKELPPHPNLVMLRGVTMPPDPVVLVMDFCDEGSLYSVLRKKQFTMTQKINFMIDTALGMVHLHYAINRREVIHRDLATRNILLKNGRAAVSDFGMATTIKKANFLEEKTVGPLKWMAPESLLNNIWSVKSDVFSFGVVMWEIIAAKDPWPGKKPQEAAELVALSGRRMDIPPNCPPLLRALINKTWQEAPERRPDFQMVVDELRAATTEAH